MILIYFFLSTIAFVLSSKNFTFDFELANTSVLLCAISYCDSKGFPSHHFSGFASSFNITKVIFNVKHDTHGFIGYRPQDKSIYVVFRGTHSVVNFLDDMTFVTTAYPSCMGCYVHAGFYSAQQVVFADILSEVMVLTHQFPEYRLIITGHSLGAAIASLTTVELIEQGIKPLPILINYGSPRIGNKEFAMYITELLPETHRMRVTHFRDAVPHVPTEAQGFMHMAGEWYLDKTGIRSCEGYEDNTCNDQWLIGTIIDHLFYLGVAMGCLWPPDNHTIEDIEVISSITVTKTFLRGQISYGDESDKL